MKTVLAAYDNSPYSQAVGSYACDFACCMNAKVAGYHVIDTAHVRALKQAFDSMPDSRDQQVMQAREEGAEAMVERDITRSEGLFRTACSASGAGFAIEHDNGAPERRIIHQAQTVDLVVVGRHGMHSSEGEFGLGHVASHVAMRSPKPVLLVPEKHAPAVRPLIAFDGHALSGHALALVADLAESCCAVPHLVTCAENEFTGGPILATGETYLKRRGVEYTSELRIGSAEGLLIDAAREAKADLIAIGGTSHGPMLRWLEYHTLDRVLEYAECPVLVFR